METRRMVLVAAYTAFALAITGLAAGLLSNGLALLLFRDETHLTGIAAAVRTVVGVLGVYAVTRWLQARVAREEAAFEVPVLPVLAGGVAGYLLDPFAWSGKAMLGQALTHAGVVTGLIDLAIWTAAVAVAANRPLGARI